MNGTQHERISELCTELRLTAVPDLYGATAQAAAAPSSGSTIHMILAVPGLRLMSTGAAAMSSQKIGRAHV